MGKSMEVSWVMDHYRVVILGAAEVGKSSLIANYTQGKDLSYKETTLISSYYPIHPEKTIRLDCWELAGNERWHQLAPYYYKDAQAALVVYDVQDPQSLWTAKEWIKKMQNEVSRDIIIAIVGNKSDLWDASCIDSIEVQNYAFEHGFIFIETSVKTGQNINELFATITQELKTRKTPMCYKQEQTVSKHRCRCGCI
ncbi:ras-related protein Rab-5A-like isoform X1 [Drosophila sulfurigaster albostrigata]|uniref:ras-related protein Rab-5A-like isoform X1 n=1 Tax=Drosophila sulfurigaster albostrigata TaxID=89887 RepID=UPI002D21A93C|nr:ras-related protein Rab-5A-like isoform X1 [Drosophila sulfurigaster albostrigata]